MNIIPIQSSVVVSSSLSTQSTSSFVCAALTHNHNHYNRHLTIFRHPVEHVHFSQVEQQEGDDGEGGVAVGYES